MSADKSKASLSKEAKLTSELAAILDERDLTDIELETETLSLRISRTAPTQHVIAGSAPMAAAAAAPSPSGSIAALPGASPSCLAAKTSSSRGVRSSSLARNGSSAQSCLRREKRCQQTPARVRPARPLRCLAAAWLIQLARSTLMRRCGSYPFSLERPESITYATSSIVSEVSAMFVLSTTFMAPLGGR